MKVILLEDIDKLGKRGAVVSVKDGYGRNFLLPRKLAARATEGSLKRVEMDARKYRVKEAKEEADALQMKSDLEKISLSISVKAGEGDVLFGSVTSADIAGLLEKKGYTIDKRKIELEEPIKRLGTYQVPVRIFKSVSADIKLDVVKE